VWAEVVSGDPIHGAIPECKLGDLGEGSKELEMQMEQMETNIEDR
jgi:hypothetical protein